MIKNIVLLFNILILVFFQNIFNNGVSINTVMPAKADPGSEFNVEVTVNKSQITGFAKLQFELPEGCSAELVESKGASFTFKDQKAKFIWMSLPPEETFNLTFKVKVDASVSGEKTVIGEFSYLENNEKRTLQIEEKKIMIGEEKPVVPPPVAETKTEEKKTEETPALATEPAKPSETPIAETVPAAVAAVTPPTPAAPAISENKDNKAVETETKTTETKTDNNVAIAEKSGEAAIAAEKKADGDLSQAPEITREIDYSNMSNKEITIYIKIKKGTLSGFSMLQETLPSGMSASKLETQGATFAYEDQKVKFLWMNIPDQNELNISYNIKVEGNLNGEYFLNGEFSYLENGETKKKIIDQQALKIITTQDQNAVAESNAKPKEIKEEQDSKVKEAAPKAEKQVKKESPKAETQIAETKKPTPKREKTPITSAQAPVTGINYKVQVAASHFVVGSDYFVKNHNLTAQVDMEMHEGWNKYTTGGFPRYNEARDHREVVRDSYAVVGPFVTAYNDGNRITVQEALMITQQKWVR